jgi:molybdopterin converting factor subunit 1
LPEKIRVLYFAHARDSAGRAAETFMLEKPTTTEELLKRIVEAHPKLAELKSSIRMSVNRELATESILVRDGDEVALLPPVAGG